jgi:hypothetical protein
MSQQYRLIIHCDEQRGPACAGLVEYSSPDRLALARESDRHPHESGWLRGYRRGQTYDVCPQCRPAVERELHERAPDVHKEIADA